jgi:small conductance mechanosensitive channel
MEKVYNNIVNWLITYGPKVVVALLILIIGEWLIHLARKWIKALLEKRHIDITLRPFVQSLASIILQVGLFLVCMQVLDVKLTLLATLIGAMGVAAGLALSGTMQNFASGILILLLKPYRVGDNIIAQAMEGSVSSIQLFYTVMTTYSNTTVIIPNSKLSNEVIINVSRMGQRRLDIQLKFGYNAGIDQVRKTIGDSLASVSFIQKEPGPRIGVLSLEPDGFIVVVNVWLQAHGFQDGKLELQETLLKDLTKAGLKV